MSTRTYALHGKQPPGWMHIMPIEWLTPQQWEAARETIRLLCMGYSYVTVDTISCVAKVSKATARKTLKKLVTTGMLYQQGHCPVMYKRRVKR